MITMAAPATAGPWSGRSLDEVARAIPERLLGPESRRRLGDRFPILVKVLDTGDWLSIQVHPDDRAAVELRGPGSLGKTEAWVVIDAAPGAEMVIGPRAEYPEAELRQGIEAGSIDQYLFQRIECRTGQVMLVPAGTLHSIGPGAFVYEIQQPSDLTFRVFDWDRPAASDRPLHRLEALHSINPSGRALTVGDVGSLATRPLVTDYFGLEAIALPAEVVRRPAGALEVITAIRGAVAASGQGFAERLESLETLVVPASVPFYELSSTDDGLVLVGRA